MVFFVARKKINFKKIFGKIKLKNFIKFRRKSKFIHPQLFDTYSDEKTRNKSVEDMPGPHPDLPLIGTSWVFSPFGPYSKDQVLTKVREDFLCKYGEVYKEKLGGAWIVSLHSPTHIELVMRSQGINPMRVVNEANIFFRRSRPDLYKSIGLIDSADEEWRKIRVKSSGPLLKPDLLKPYSEVLSSLAQDFVHVLKSETNGTVGGALGGETDGGAVGGGETVGGALGGETDGGALGGGEIVGRALGNGSVDRVLDVRPFLYRYTLEAIWKMTLGHDLGALKLKPSERVSNLIHQSFILFNSVTQLSTSRPWWKLWPTAFRICPLTTFSKFCSSEETVFRIVSEHTESLMKEISKECKSEVVSNPSILRHYLKIEDFDSKDINTILVDLIVAGISTTTYFLCLLLHRLGQEEKIQVRLQKELDQIFDRRDVVITEDHLRSLPYLKAVLKEGLRLTTIIPGIMKILPVDIICDQYLIPANTPIICQMRAASRSKKYFSLPEEFIPERFLNKADSAGMKQLQKEVYDNRFLLLPFGFGPRGCIGKRIVEKEMIIFLAKVFLNFSVRSAGELELSNRFLIGPKGSVPLQFIPRS
ncbi:UNVERIFIED_CONTAM: hypothetical protein RMT77_016000 [Armadillidium vulgare]